MRHSAQRDTLARVARPSVPSREPAVRYGLKHPRAMPHPARVASGSRLVSGIRLRNTGRVRDVSFQVHHSFMLRGCLSILFLSPCARSVPDLRELQKAVVSVRRAHTPLCAPPTRCISRRARSTAVLAPRMRPNASRCRDSGNHPETQSGRSLLLFGAAGSGHRVPTALARSAQLFKVHYWAAPSSLAPSAPEMRNERSQDTRRRIRRQSAERCRPILTFPN